MSKLDLQPLSLLLVEALVIGDLFNQLGYVLAERLRYHRARDFLILDRVMK
jgi:hypothetical protein